MIHARPCSLALGLALALYTSAAHAQPSPAPEARTAQARYTDAAVDLACDGQRLAAVGQEDERAKLHDKTLARHGFTRASFLDASLLYGSSPEVTKNIGLRALGCEARPAAGLVAGVYLQEFHHEDKIHGWLALSVLPNGHVGGLLSGSVDGAAMRFRVEPQHLQGEKLAFWFTIAEGAAVGFEGKLSRGSLQGQLSFSKPPAEPRRVGIYSAARR